MLENKRNYIVKLIDFGVADRIKKNDQAIKEAVGTAYYIAPEVLLGECDVKCDIWSLGVILYMMVSGKPPFEGADDREIIRKVRAGKFSMDSEEFNGISAECKDLIQWMLTMEPKQRPHAKDALKHMWIRKRYAKSMGTSKEKRDALVNLQRYEPMIKFQESII